MHQNKASFRETIDLIIGVSTVVVSSLIYKKIHTRKGAVYAMLAGMAVWTTVAVLANYYFAIDFYLEFFFGGNIDALLGFMSVIPGITAENYLIKFAIYAAIPFNLLLSGLVYGITFIVYKRISHLLEDLRERFSE